MEDKNGENISGGAVEHWEDWWIMECFCKPAHDVCNLPILNENRVHLFEWHPVV